MNNSDLYKRVKEYILERHCSSGGFCFYKLEEPNGADTFYAISVLNLLGFKYYDTETVKYLKDLQHEDGGYDSIFSAFYSIKSLGLLYENPRLSPTQYIVEKLRGYHLDAERLPAEITSVFKRLLYLVDLYYYLEIHQNFGADQPVIDFVLSFQNKDKGFGYSRSSLSETSKALSILKLLDFNINDLNCETFIQECETSICGFTDIPNTSLSYIEYLDAGVLASYLLHLKPSYLRACTEFIKNCQTRSGGFSRSPNTGIATMEDTYYGVHSLIIIDNIYQEKWDEKENLGGLNGREHMSIY